MHTDEAETAVVVGVDGSEQSFVAARYALREAESLGCGVLLVHAYTPMQNDYWTDDAHLDMRVGGEQVLHDFAEMLRREATPATAISTMLCPGDPTGTLVQLSEASPCIVVGRRSAGWFQHLIVHSVSAGLSAASRCPSVTIPQQCSHPSHDGGIAVLIDSAAEAASCLTYAAEAAHRRRTDVTVVHAGPLHHREWPTDEDILSVSEVVESFRALHPTTPFTTSVTQDPIDVAAADLSKCVSALVLSQSGSPNLLGWRRSALRAVLKKSSCPVIAVPSSRRAARLHPSRAEPRPFRFPRW